MADKQFARSGPAEFDTLADDDPLSELARIVGYDARPAVQQLQELQRHQEAIRRDPAFDLEEELLRAFDSYDAPRAEPIHPDSGLLEHPAAVADPLGVTAHAAEPHFEPVVPLEHSSGESAHMRPADDVAPIEQAAEATIEQEVEASVTEDIDPAFDLERELELSLGQEDLSGEPAARADDIAQSVAPSETGDLSTFDDWQEPLASRLAAAGKLAEQVEVVEPVYVDMADDLAGAGEQVVLNEALAVDAPAAGPSMAHASVHVDRLAAGAEHVPVSTAEGPEVAAFAAAPPVAVPPAPVARKSSYPFTPTFSRATPVASPAGASPQRAFATPMSAPVFAEVPAVAEAPVVSVVPPKPEPEVIQGKLDANEPEPSFDIENFELELADVALDMDLSDDRAPKAAVDMPAQPVVTHPALVEPAAQPFLQALAMPSMPEPLRQQPNAVAPIEIEEAPADNALPFDPAMIGDTETGVAPIAELDVPALPHIEAEEKPIAYTTDFDLDIDAEMAQLFGTPARAAKGNAHPVDADIAGGSQPVAPGDAGVPLASIDDFNEFEKAMEEDFRRSMEQRRGDVQDVDRLAALPRAGSDDYLEEEGYGRRSQRTMLLAASVAGVIILGGAAVYAWMGGSSAALT
ncbi:MAG TPA: SPOR domain-containing protein, partial [Sinorhizobium sp.]|nr:SPOR domain-containing protein [Sinorhizobium sp.]